jgi:pimeloyl-ACP methyl ester carboxylesterase
VGTCGGSLGQGPYCGGPRPARHGSLVTPGKWNQFAAFTQDAADNKLLAEKGKLTMPVFAFGGDHSFGMQMAEIMRLVARDVTGGVITDSGHWVMEEQPRQTTAAIVKSIGNR